MTSSTMPPGGSDRTLYEWFALSAERHPDLPAVRFGRREVSYRQLHASALGLAGRIVHECGGRPARVALLASRSLVAFAGYLAALRLGAAVVPLNPGFPATRNRTVCELAGVDLVVADEAGSTGWSAGSPVGQSLRAGDPDGEVTFVQLSDADLGDTGGVGGSAGADDPGGVDLPPYQGACDDVAYILFTSGSTGLPKGVPIRHRHASPYVAYNIARYQVGPGCRLSHTFDLTFDPSVFDLFVTWGGGGTLVVPGVTDLLTPVDYIADNGITHWFSVPSVISVSSELGNLRPGAVEDLRFSVFIGEPLSYQQARMWREVAPDAVIENVYGPTELAIACTSYRLAADPDDWVDTSNDTVPIGPVYGFLDHLLVDDGVTAGTEGELCVRGPQRFDGYVDPNDNAGRFVTVRAGRAVDYDGRTPLTDADYYRTGDRVRLEAGNLVHLGRLDNQVKVRGYRIELGEIEAVLRRHPSVSQAVVVATRPLTGSGEPAQVELVGFYTGTELPSRDLVRWLRKRLPMQMVPRRFHRLEEMPLNANGKTDRGALRDLPREAHPTDARPVRGS